MGAIFVRVHTTPLFVIIETRKKDLRTQMLTFRHLKKILFCYKQQNLLNLFNKLNCAKVKVQILLDSGSERCYISRRAKNILSLTHLNSEKLKINTFGSATSKVTTVQRVNLLIKTTHEKLTETDTYTSPLLCSPLQYQPL